MPSLTSYAPLSSTLFPAITLYIICVSLHDEPTCTYTGLPSLGKVADDTYAQSGVSTAGCLSPMPKSTKSLFTVSVPHTAHSVCLPDLMSCSLLQSIVTLRFAFAVYLADCLSNQYSTSPSISFAEAL